MRRPKVLIDIDSPTNPKVLELPTDAQRWAWIVLLCKAKTVGGSFASEAQLKELMAARYKHVEALRAVGLLDGLDVHDWEFYQVDRDPTNAVRQRRYREKSNGKSNAPNTPVTPPEGEGEREGEIVTSVTNPPVPPVPVQNIWQDYQLGTGRKRAVLTDALRKLIRTRVHTYGEDTVINACYGWRHDDWEDRPQHLMPEDIWRPTNIERFAEWHLAGTGPTRVIAMPRKVLEDHNYHEQLRAWAAQEEVDAEA